MFYWKLNFYVNSFPEKQSSIFALNEHRRFSTKTTRKSVISPPPPPPANYVIPPANYVIPPHEVVLAKVFSWLATTFSLPFHWLYFHVWKRCTWFWLDILPFFSCQSKNFDNKDLRDEIIDTYIIKKVSMIRFYLVLWIILM